MKHFEIRVALGTVVWEFCTESPIEAYSGIKELLDNLKMVNEDLANEIALWAMSTISMAYETQSNVSEHKCELHIVYCDQPDVEQ